MDKWYDPIIVLGTGRSGTSAVAGILYHLGVHMGFDFKPPDEQNIHGYFEDIEISQLNNSLIRDEITLRQWNLQMALTFAKRRKLHRPWGWKHPMTADYLLPTMSHFINPWIIRLQRNETDTINSFIRAYAKDGVGDEQAKHFVASRKAYMDKWLQDYNVLLIQYEDVCYDAERMVDVLTQFTGLEPTDMARKKAIESIHVPALRAV